MWGEKGRRARSDHAAAPEVAVMLGLAQRQLAEWRKVKWSAHTHTSPQSLTHSLTRCEFEIGGVVDCVGSPAGRHNRTC